MHDQAKLVADLRALGLQPGDAVMVHSSYELHSIRLLTIDQFCHRMLLFWPLLKIIVYMYCT